jgi:hypothetical protein
MIRLLLAALTLAACDIGRPIQDQHPTVQRAPASVDDSQEAKRDALNRTVAIDLHCNAVEIVLVLERRYANTAAPRYVIEACGTRALYAETCESYPACRYVLLSTVKLAPATVPMPSAAPAAPMPPPAASAVPDPFPDAGTPPPKFL